MSLEFAKLKILFINIFQILLKATTLNPYKLQTELNEVDTIIHSDCELCHTVLGLFICLYLQIKFVMGYTTLAANVIAIFPILTDDLPHLLLPALFAQSIDHIAFNFIEIILGLCTLQLMTAKNMSIFYILLLNKVLHIIFAITALNIYSDYYQQLKFIALQLQLTQSEISQEKLIKTQSLD